MQCTHSRLSIHSFVVFLQELKHIWSCEEKGLDRSIILSQFGQLQPHFEILECWEVCVRLNAGPHHAVDTRMLDHLQR